jgi:pimeloyl-ACP methyl ester carboxylesterase
LGGRLSLNGPLPARTFAPWFATRGGIAATGRSPAFDVYGQRQSDVAVVLLHGFPDDASAWRPMAPALAAAGHYVVAPYTRGCGPSRFRSEATPRSGQVAARMRDVLALINQLGLRRVILVGQDGGSATAQALAMMQPERVDRLVLLNGHRLFNWAVFAKGARPSWETPMMLRSSHSSPQ